MKKTLCFAFAASLLSSAPAFAQVVQKDGFYGSLSAGYLQLRDREGTAEGVSGELEYDAGYAITGAVGYKSGPFRGELELGYARSGVDTVTGGGLELGADADIDIFTASVNGYYDIQTGTAFTPYLGAGIGLAHSSIDDVTVSFGGQSETFDGDSSTDLLLQAEAGLSYAVAPNVSVVPAYRFVWINNGGNGIDDDTAHLFKIGVRVGF
ncbi:outer membrane protein [Arenibaculum pallidiluteum]|uniref:outer membrane protein n=1 Tax=Arenibaculum pallidiluteum TaxID=2812559 RepID=UPI001A96771D|nr:outer membrane beta-barrel protein [Arenibaculum pallidiluteum]